MTHPEHDKLALVQPQSQAIGEFIEWLADGKGIVLAQWEGNTLYPEHSTLWPSDHNSVGLLAEFFDIDLDVIEAEKRAMLESIREANQHNV